ncbi:MAG: class I SAM-dependent methyltransferase [Boseongicola sp.]|nr:class I SAM-dependent methyltransferase [Silicimonas sp.]NNF91010.1 class I SAM-dependent methyltransferase [Boseongicola sp.]
MADRKTLDVYARRAEDYSRRFDAEKPGKHLLAFIEALPADAKVLDLGCGTGRAARFMRQAGFSVDAWDASPEMARVAKETHDLDVIVATFDQLDAVAVYDGVFASFTLLHAPKSQMPDHLARIRTALRPGGLFYLGLKTGQGEKRDKLGRFYAYYEDAEITGLLEDAGFTVETRDTGSETGLDGTVAPWIILTARIME